MTLEDYHALTDAGTLSAVELREGRVVMGDYELALSPEQMRAARALGLEPRSYVDAVLEDEQALDELRRRLREELMKREFESNALAQLREGGEGSTS